MNDNSVHLQGQEIPQLHNFPSERQSQKIDLFYHISESTEKGNIFKTFDFRNVSQMEDISS